ncbi:MAG TPA: bacillithiol biosynthesis cysteine-adding enzyme BshC [Candidatus Dormibacteraeota bacterium]|jgi:bacillithiol biosynthesis cysteine-adding enzyme BshC|nr:bacillithiol biosynthesis cysteine-adding enzyme BshC [Candidatus Dormibacteraeota bacterium]
MQCRALAFRELPHQPPLHLAFHDDFQKVKDFYAHEPTLENAAQLAANLHYPQSRRSAVATILREQNELLGSSKDALNNISRLESGAVAVVSGQQVGLFGGPAYAFYKALSAIEGARLLTKTGIEAVPVFWMATEDHDLDEVRHNTFFHDGKLVKFELTAQPGVPAPVGPQKLGPQVEEFVRAASVMLGGPAAGEIATLLRASYTADETYASAFGKLFAGLFSAHGLIILDPLDARLHRLAEPIYRQAAEDHAQLNEGLLARNKELERAGFASQVKVTGRSTALFFLGNGGREAIRSAGAQFQADTLSWSSQELVNAISQSPESFSPNALLRPVVQDYLLPTVAYIGGPSEIAYFAQSDVLYSKLLRREPVFLSRTGFTLVDSKAQRLLEQYNMTVEDVWTGSQTVQSRLGAANIPAKLNTKLEKDAQKIHKLLEGWRDPVTKIDPSLKSTVEKALRKISYQTEKLRQRAGWARDKKTSVLAGHAEFLSNLLYPNKTLQSRQLCLLPLLARWGMEGLDALQKHSSGRYLGKHFLVPIP